MNRKSIKTNIKSPKLIRMLNKKNDLWTDNETDLSSLSDNDRITISPIQSNIKNSIDENNQLLKMNCCLICSILSSLSNVNCCQKHLTLLTTPISQQVPAQIVYMMHPAVTNWPKLECHCRLHSSKSRKRHRSSSSSSSSSSLSSSLSSCSSSKCRKRRKKRFASAQSSVKIY